MNGPMVVGVDGSEGSLFALDGAAGLAGTMGTTLVVTHVRSYEFAVSGIVWMADHGAIEGPGGASDVTAAIIEAQ